MSEHISRLFSFSSGIDCVQETSQVEKTALPRVNETLLPVQNDIATLNTAQDMAGMDDMLRDALKPEVEDASVLIPNRFYGLLNDTQVYLKRELEDNRSFETKDALSALVSLLEENMTLMDQFNHYTSVVQRA